jgi:hypothetical protein
MSLNQALLNVARTPFERVRAGARRRLDETSVGQALAANTGHALLERAAREPVKAPKPATGGLVDCPTCKARPNGLCSGLGPDALLFALRRQPGAALPARGSLSP